MPETVTLTEGYSFKKTLAKGAKSLLLQAGVVAGVALVAFLTDAESVKRALGDMPGAVAIVPLIVAVGEALRNWLKHKND